MEELILFCACLFSFADISRMSVPQNGRSTHKQQICRAEYQRLQGVSVLVVDQRVLLFRDEHELAERQAVILDVSQYANGVYIIHIRELNNHNYKKLIVSH